MSIDLGLDMIYLFLGSDRAAKDLKIADIKKKYLADSDALKLDYESLHGAKLDADTLKQALLAIPAVSKKRLLLIRAVDKLDAHNKNMILEYIQAKNPPAVVVLDSDEQAPKGSFFTKLNSAAKVMRFEEGASPKNVFDMTRALEGRNVAGALKTLKELTDGGEHPLQIMGGIVWF